MAIGLIIGAVTATIAFQTQSTVWERNLQYRIGEIDSRFNLRYQDLQDVTIMLSSREMPMSHKLFVYDSTVDFAISLVLDERQQATISGRNLSLRLECTEISHNQVNQQHLGRVTFTKNAWQISNAILPTTTATPVSMPITQQWDIGISRVVSASPARGNQQRTRPARSHKR